MNTDASNPEAVTNKDIHPRLSAVSLALTFEAHPKLSQELKTRLNRK